ncbi:hypothetical protein [Tepidibacter hydrothermalis]|uniref:DUF2953 domain-containing protein n=1 Tax=Tepidibacter hydrothermalis TaxID=3036126 RepID=A0ABY8E7D1_9FIRM|nr:hypothetical protein [Tepidibacter hydrothermalis]WFD08793.1 hypothetical protein P4S50_10325 [Tepidibacter hydrothermalis]
MKIIVYIFLFLIFLGIIILTSNVKIRIKLIKNGQNDEIAFKIKGLFGIIKYEKKYSFLDLSVDEEGINLEAAQDTSTKGDLINSFKERLNNKEILKGFESFKKTLEYLLGKADIRKIKIDTYISNENVFLSIFLFNFTNIIFKYIYDKANIDDLKLNIKPGFNENVFKIYIITDFNLKVINSIRLFKEYRTFKINKGGA